MPASGLDFFYIIKPEATKNLHTNPSIETNTTKYSAANGSTLARVTTQQRRGSCSLSVTPTSNTDGGVDTGTFTVDTGGFAASFDFLGVLGVNYYAQFLNSGSTKIGTPVTFTGTGTWQRYEIFHSGVTSIYLTIRKNNSSNTGAFFVDGVLLENKVNYSTTYGDGDSDGWFWDALAHGSTSQRYANYRAGGRKINLSTYNAYVLDMTGVGAAPVETSIIPYGNIPGGLYQGTTVKERTMTIGVTVSGGNTTSVINPDDLQMWQINMEYVFDLIKPNLVYPQQPFVLGYQHGSNDIEIDCVYANGMDLQNEKLKGITDITFQVQCPSPFWRETYTRRSTVSQSPTKISLGTNGNIYVRDSNGTLTDITSGTSNGYIYAMHIGAVDGKLYVGGDFTSIAGVSANYIAVYDFMTATWSALGTGMDGIVRAIVQIDNGNVIVGGDFSTGNGVSAARIAQWNGSTFTIVGKATSFGGGVVTSLAIDPTSRDVMVGGTFIAGTTTGCLTNYLGRVVTTGVSLAWTAATSFTIQTAGATGVYDIKCYGKYVYVTGKWTSIGAGGNILTNNGFARFNSLSSLFENVGVGFGAASTGSNLAIDSGGGVYVFGDFTTFSGVTVSYLAYYNGYQVSSPVTTVPTIIAFSSNSSMFIDNNGQLVLHVDGRATWRLIGTRLVMDVFKFVPGSGGVPEYHYNKENGSILFASNNGEGQLSNTTVITNNGSADVNPIIRLTAGYTAGLIAPAVFYIKNNTNGKALYFNYFDVLNTGAGNVAPLIINREVITIDCRPNGLGVYSTLREKNVPLDPVSQETDFFLVPGDNYIEVVTEDSTNASPLTIEFFYTELHWSFFGGHS